MKIYLDNCCFNRPYDDQDSLIIRIETEVKLEIQDRVRSGRINLVWSYIWDYENSLNPHKERSEEISEWRNIAKMNEVSNEFLLSRMREYEKNGFKAADALHLSCAVEAKCEYFITVDKGILNKNKLIQDVCIINHIAFIEEQDEK